MNKFKIVFIILISCLFIWGVLSCKSVKIPNGVCVVRNFDAKSYMSEWYEIARINFKHEKDMIQVTANYSLKDNRNIEVVNKGYDTLKDEWKQSVGKAKFNGNENEGALKVSFFGPFYSGYNVVMLSDDYSSALIFGETKDYLWILSREKTISESVKNDYLEFAKNNGYDLSRIIWTEQK